MAVKKGILDNFLKPSSHSLYSDNQKDLRSIFIDKTEDDFKPEPTSSFESSLIGTQQEHIRNTIGTQISSVTPIHSAVPQEIGTQLEHNKNTTGTQQEHIKDTIRTHKEHKKVNRNTTGTQQEHAKEHVRNTNKNTDGTQQEHIKNTRYGLSYLSGIQKQLITFFYISCKKNRSHMTEEFSLINIAHALNIKLGSVKNSLRRLEEKGFIKPVQFKKGRGGWTQFELPDNVYRDLLERDKEHNWNTSGTQMEHITNTYRNTEKDTNDSRRRSLVIKDSSSELEEWDFDISAYEPYGFTKDKLGQIIRMECFSVDQVQSALLEWKFDIDNKHRDMNFPINYLMKCFREKVPYSSDVYRKNINAELSEMKERLEKKQLEKQQAMILKWYESLNDDALIKIENALPMHLKIRYDLDGILDKDVFVWAKQYYKTINS